MQNGRVVEPPTYYEQPALKPSDWRWLIVTYLFIGGMSGAAQVIAGVLDLLGHERDRPIVRAARYLALAGSLISPVLLIADLKTPSRWYNMLRVFRSTSPMSIGSWTLFAFGGTTGLAAMAQLFADVFHMRAARGFARLIGIPAAVCGALLSTYTGSLVSGTSTPLWASGYEYLPAIFGLSGTSTAVAALSLLVRSRSAPLGRLALLVSLLEFLLTTRLDAKWKGEQLSGPLEESDLAIPYRVGALGLGTLTPLGVHALQVLTGRDLKTASTLAAWAALSGGFMQRSVILFAGRRSAERPRDYFRMASGVHD